MSYRTVARPYAKAAFEYAMAHEQLDTWYDFLKVASQVTAEPRVILLCKNPEVSKKSKEEFILSIWNDGISQEQKNFIETLSYYNRLLALPDVAALFEDMQNEYNKTIEAEMVTAFPISKELKEQIRKALAIRLQKKVVLTAQIDDSLVGGAIIRAGDLVIDRSVHGQLKLLEKRIQS